MRHAWIASSGRALDVRIDEPAQGAGGVLIVLPPLGREAVVAFRTLRYLCIDAAQRGLVAVYASLTGEGDSSTMDTHLDPSSVWREDAAAVVDWARQAAPNRPVHVVAVRAAAGLIGDLTPRPGERRILWEGVSGSAYVRYHSRVRRLSIPMTTEHGLVELPGQFFTEQQADSVRTLAPPADPLPDGFVRWNESDPDVQIQLGLCSPHHVDIPYAAVRRLLQQIPVASPLPLPQDVREQEATVAGPDNARVTERHVTLEHGLTGILTIPHSPARAGLVLTASGAELQSGPGSLWAKVARRLAAEGVMTLRADRRTLGDDTVVSVPHEARPYTADAVTDVANAIDYVRDVCGGPVAAAGVCAGAWAGLNAARLTALDLCVPVNPLTWVTEFSLFNEDYYEQLFRAEADVDARQLVGPAPASPWKDSFSAAQLIAKRKLLNHLPGLKDLIRGRPDPQGARPSDLLLEIPGHTKIHLVMGAYEFQGLPERSVLTGRQRPVPNLNLSRIDIDHSLLSARAQAAFGDLLQRILSDWLPPSSGTPGRLAPSRQP